MPNVLGRWGSSAGSSVGCTEVVVMPPHWTVRVISRDGLLSLWTMVILVPLSARQAASSAEGGMRKRMCALG